MALKTRDAYFRLAYRHRYHAPLSDRRLVSSITGMPIPRNKAVVGENAFAHESGIHQHGMLKHHSTYEIMRPEDVGLTRTHLVLGKHSGRHALRERVKRTRLRARRAGIQPACSRNSRRSPTRRRSCSTATSKRWCCAPAARRVAPGRWCRLRRQARTGAEAVGDRASRAPGRALDRKAGQRRWPGRCVLQGDRAGHRHDPSTCASSKCAACRTARMHRAKRWFTSSTMAARIAAPASAPTSSSRARAPSSR